MLEDRQLLLSGHCSLDLQLQRLSLLSWLLLLDSTFFVMFFDNQSHVLHTTIADLYVVLVE